jgi:hypothetical protein
MAHPVVRLADRALNRVEDFRLRHPEANTLPPELWQDTLVPVAQALALNVRVHRRALIPPRRVQAAHEWLLACQGTVVQHGERLRMVEIA